MSVVNLDKMFQPRSIAVVGASEEEGSIGSAVMVNLIQGEYPGEIYPVSPYLEAVWKRRAYPSLMDLEAPVDLVIIAMPITSVQQIVKESIETGVGGAVIISAGGRETRQQDLDLEKAIKKEVAGSDLRIIGPNSLGIVCSKSKLNVSLASPMPLAGKLAFISQSGAICTSVLELAVKEQLGFSYVINLGSMLDVDFGDLIDFLGGDPDVSSIVVYLESLSRFRNFMSASRAVSRVKPIVALKSGRSRAGELAVASRTGVLAGEDAVYDAAFKRAGIVRVKTFEELFDCAELLAKQCRPSGPGLAIVTNSGGPGVMAADTLSDYGMEPATLGPETIEKLDEILPSQWGRSNPVDIMGDASPQLCRRAVEICLNASEVDALLILLVPRPLTDPSETALQLADLFRRRPYPVFVTLMGGAGIEKAREIFSSAGIPVFDTPERAVRAFMDLYHYSKNLEMLQEIPSKIPVKLDFDYLTAQKLIQKGLDRATPFLTEVEAKTLISAYGIPVNRTLLAVSAEEAIQKARHLGFPVVMKTCSIDIIHKTDINGIQLNLKNAADVSDAFKKIVERARAYNPEARIEGVTIQPMPKSDYELILGSKRDSNFGPIILFGMGGMMTEVLKDWSIALPPLNRLLARRLMEETKVYRLLQGWKNYPPANLMLLEEILVRLSQLITDFAEIEELDIDPVIITKDDVFAVDVSVCLKTSRVPAPLHLVISPYPNQYETHTVTEGGIEIFIRPIRPEDAPLMEELFESLSPISIYNRFFTPLKSLPYRMLSRFTQIDYDREIALVAIQESGPSEKMLGVARVIVFLNQKQAEFSILIGDKWQGKGLGAELMKRCLSISKERGVMKVFGVVLPENVQMLALGKKMGFKIKRNHYENGYELHLDLRDL